MGTWYGVASRVATLAFACITWFALLAGTARGDNAQVTVAGSCPPNGYAYIDPMTGMLVKPAQPAYDYDIDGVGGNDSWISAPLVETIGNPLQIWPAKDAAGTELCVPCIPDPAGDGCGQDYFSPRAKIGGMKPGLVIGKCHYAYGRNRWVVCFEDMNPADGTPDRFTKSKWTTRDGGDKNAMKCMGGANDNQPCTMAADCPGGACVMNLCFSATAGERYEYVADLLKQKVVSTKIKPTGGGLLAVAPFLIADARIVELGADPTLVPLDGAVPPTPPPAFLGDGDPSRAQTLGDVPRAVNSLVDPGAPATPGAVIAVTGGLMNLDGVSHTYLFDLFGVNAGVLTDPATLTATVGPGQTHTYSVSVQVAGPGPAALVVLASSSTGAPEDSDLDAVVLESAEDPAGARLNEIYASHTGTDDREMIELVGVPGASLDGYVVCVVEGEGPGSNQGVLDRAFDLTGFAFDPNGYFVLADGAEPDKDFDMGAQDQIENGTETFHLVHTVVPAVLAALVGTDLDPDGDLLTSLSALGTVVDAVAMVDPQYDEVVDELMDFATVVGPDGDFFPAGIFRTGDYPGKWCTVYLDFDDVANASQPRTPKAKNVECDVRTYGTPRCASSNGRMRFEVTGDTTAGTGAVDLTVRNGPPNGLAGIFLSAAEGSQFISGGCIFLVDPPFAVIVLALDAAGDAVVSGIALPASLAGLTAYAQPLSLEGQRFADSNALEVRFP